MWHKKQNNMIFPNQVIGPPLEPQTTCTDNMHVKPSGASDRDFLGESSRKRKAVSMDQPSNNASDDISQSVLNYLRTKESNQQHKVDVLSGMNLQGSTLGVFSNLTPQSAEPNAKVLQFERYQFQSPNNFSMISQVNDGNFPRTAPGKTNNLCSSTQPHSFHQQGLLTSINLPAGEFPTLLDSLPLTYNMFRQIGENKFPLYPDPSNESMEKAQSGQCLKDGMNFGHGNHIVRDDSPLEPHSKLSENLGSIEASQLNNEGFAHLDGRTCIQDVCKTGYSFEVKQSDQNLGVAGRRDTSIGGTGSLGTSPYTGGKEIDQSCQNSSPLSSNLDNGVMTHLKDRDQSNGDHDTQNMEQTEGSNAENSKYSLGEEFSPKNADNPSKILVGNEHGDDVRNASHSSDGKSKSHTGKAVPSIVEKLWEGSLQLNASRTVSAVAFFKSGEKAPEINWSKSIEVKGKVRLEAFEKFIQELPRSRSRALMVTSLCWKVGSSETGLKGMKEVTKGYKEGDRVGFAQLSPGIDLYVCPRSDTIITILAKYGFFKGMAAIEDDQDSLIGCVVWRRNLTSSVTSSKKCDRKNLSVSEKPLASPSSTAIQPNVEANAPFSQPGAASSSPGSETGPIALESAGSTSIESKNIHSGRVQVEVGKSFTNVDSKLTPLIPDNSPAISMGLQAAMHADSSSTEGPMGLKVEVPLIHGSGPEKPDTGYELQKPVLPAQPQIVTQNKPSPDDDDLPEFDFSTACVVSQSSVSKSRFSSNNDHISNAVALDQRFLSIGAKNVGGPMPSTLPSVQQMIIANQQRSQSPTFPGLTLDSCQGISQRAKKLGQDVSLRPVLPFPEKRIIRGSDLPSQPGIGKPANRISLPPRNLWEDDDDDMPEWCPPNLEHKKQSPAVANLRPTIPCIPSTVPNPTSKKLPHGPPLPRPSPPPPMSVYPPLRPQDLPHGYQPCPITITVKPAQTSGFIRFGPSSSLGLNSNPNLRPSSNMFDVRHPIRPADWRGWRP